MPPTRELVTGPVRPSAAPEQSHRPALRPHGPVFLPASSAPCPAPDSTRSACSLDPPHAARDAALPCREAGARHLHPLTPGHPCSVPTPAAPPARPGSKRRRRP